ncbi:MAG: AAC(3) family N-acetyltransferase [Planctomycetota bacterium]|jgi:aminoglycoside 3-N-acetyltransferase|nr:AAC(3) family N-acetyltransferase [Planctomycetota bacterium]MDP7253417.1 AAC(3) family N-acetyltransferase [Planctomycetota bacterium]
MPITHERLVTDFSSLGIGEGDLVAMHSSLKSIGQVEGGADTVIDSLLACVGSDGTLMTPTFTNCFEGSKNTDVFERESTPSLTGLITEMLRKRPEAFRSLHPTHSAAAIGRLAEEITRDHLRATPLGAGSPFHRLCENDGWILLVGVGQDTNSFVHVAEVMAGVSYVNVFCWLHLDWRPSARFIDEDGQERTLDIYECPGDSRAFHKINPLLIERGCLREGLIGHAPSQLMKASHIYEVVRDAVEEDPAFVLCEEGTCRACDVRRASIGMPARNIIPPSEEWVR